MASPQCLFSHPSPHIRGLPFSVSLRRYSRGCFIYGGTSMISKDSGWPIPLIGRVRESDIQMIS